MISMAWLTVGSVEILIKPHNVFETLSAILQILPCDPLKNESEEEHGRRMVELHMALTLLVSRGMESVRHLVRWAGISMIVQLELSFKGLVLVSWLWVLTAKQGGPSKRHVV